jgi:hypothetical protein
VKDQAKKLVVTMAIALPITAFLLYIIKAGGDYFFVYTWIFVFIMSLVNCHFFLLLLFLCWISFFIMLLVSGQVELLSRFFLSRKIRGFKISHIHE